MIGVLAWLLLFPFRLAGMALRMAFTAVVVIALLAVLNRCVFNG